MSFSSKLNRRHAVGALLAGTGALTAGSLRVFAREEQTFSTEGGGRTAAAGQTSTGNRVWMVGAATLAHRTQLMRELMDRKRLDALAFSSWLDLKFAANFNGSGGLYVVPRSGEPFLILPKSSANGWRYQATTKRLWPTDVTVGEKAGPMPKDLLIAKFEKAGLARARIGIKSEGLRAVLQPLPQLQIQNIARDIDDLRLIKSEEEVAVMREAASLADWIQARYRENIRPGRLVGELDMSMTALGYAEATRRFPRADITIPCWTLSGPITASPHGAGSAFGNLSGAKIEKGHVLINNVTPALDGIYIENERTWFCGKPSQRQARLFEAVYAAQQAACEAVVTGRPISGIDSASLTVFERLGLADLVLHRTGHGLGLPGHDTPTDMAFNTNPLPERMVTSVEPSLLEYGLGGFRIDDTVVARKTPEILTRSPKDIKSQTVV